MESIDVIIPTYKPDRKFLKLIHRLEQQTVPVRRIIIMNTEQKYFDRLVLGTSFLQKNNNVEVYHISKEEFDHGKTRDIGIRKSDARYCLLMTQDAVPADRKLVENLLGGFVEKKTAVSYARQLPEKGSGIIEAYTRNFNYPALSSVKGKEDLGRLGIKTYFCSNVCAMYHRDIYEQLGGFTKHTIFNEDMIYAAAAVSAGYRISYAAQAAVFHSHNYTNLEQFRRNFDLGVSHADYPEVFASLPSQSEGIRLVTHTARYLAKKGESRLIPALFIKSGFKFLGYQFGKRYRALPERLVLRMTMNRMYWESRGAAVLRSCQKAAHIGIMEEDTSETDM